MPSLSPKAWAICQYEKKVKSMKFKKIFKKLNKWKLKAWNINDIS